MGRQGHDTSAPAPGMRIQRSQSKMSLSASFEALAVYFPCMNSFDEEDGGKDDKRGDVPSGRLPGCSQLSRGDGSEAGETDVGLVGRYRSIDCWEAGGGEYVISLIGQGSSERMM